MTATIPKEEISIRECETLDELATCVELQREVFGVSDAELLPLRYFVAAKSAGGWTLGAFAAGELIGFVLSLNAFIKGRRAFYSHLAAVSPRFEGKGIGARLKWAQRQRALDEHVSYIRWAMDPAKARNAFFSLEKLGGTVLEFKPNYQGSELLQSDGLRQPVLESDRVFVDWQLDSDKVKALASGENYVGWGEPKQRICVPVNWNELVKTNPVRAISERARIRKEFEQAFSSGLICRGFQREEGCGRYLLYGYRAR